MDPVTLLSMAVESITAHKLRSFLVTLGILIGVTAVLVNAAMVEGFQSYFEEQMQALGTNFVTIRPASSLGLLGPLEKGQILDTYLFDSVSRLPYVDSATASRTSYGTIRFMGQEASVLVIGAEPGYLTGKNRTMLIGDSLVQQDTFNAVVGHTVMSSAAMRPVSLMSRFELAINVDGEEITEEFRVKGVVEQPETGIGISVVYVPIRTLNVMLGSDGYDEITLFASDVDAIATVKMEAQQMLDRLLKVEPDRSIAPAGQQQGFFGMPAPLSETSNREYRITTQSDILAISEDISAMIQLALVAIAGISLLVGGIGIANVMLVTVAERTREIGVMKAVGARNRQVLTAFLFEAAVIGMLGGLVGLALASLATFTMVPLLFDVPGALPLEWVAVAVGISLAISLLSGLYPALRASRMDPVEALRTE